MSSASISGGREGSPRQDQLRQDQLRIYVDADVLIAGASSPSDHSASQVLLTLSEITLIECITSQLALDECRRNLEAKLPGATGDFERLVRRSLSVEEPPSRKALLPYTTLRAAFGRTCVKKQ